MTEQKTHGTWTWTERQEIVREYRQSGQNQRAFCEQWGIVPSTLRNWCRRLSEGDQDDDPKAVAATRLLPVSLCTQETVAPGTGITLVARNGLRIDVAPQFDATTLQRVLATLEAVA